MKSSILLLAIIALLASSCTKAADKDEVFQTMYPDINWNEEISLKVDFQHPSNRFINRGTVFFVIYNNSSGDYYFNLDENVLIFYFDYEEEQWKEVDNTIKYAQDSKDGVIRSKVNSDRGGMGFIAYTPSIPKLDKDLELRFLITGSIEYPDGEVKPTGAYADVVISP